MRPDPAGTPQLSSAVWGRMPVWLVYYRVLSSHLEHAVLAVQQQQQQLRGAYPGLRAALMRRSDEHPAQATLMEIYALPGEAVSLPAPALRDAIEAAMAPALVGLLQGERHGEGFLPCA